MYQTGGTIKNTIEFMQKHEYVLPAIQREFVWRPEQIQRLFDSIMQGYPFGTLLLWNVQAENSAKYKFYDFVREYHERDNPHCPPLPIQRNRKITAVLDGQQRLTALNIGLCGSMAIKLPNKWWNNPDAFPTRYLCLNLLAPPEPNEGGDKYHFEFLKQEQIDHADSSTTCWFKVADILDIQTLPQMLRWLNQRLAQAQTDAACDVLHRLHEAVHLKPLVAYYEERSQDISTVLNIFIRMNSGGTILSYSDLLLSIATAQWEELDARKEIHELVDELNNIGDHFAFSKDLILKAGLVLANIGNVGFKVENFNHRNMVSLERQWQKIKETLFLTVQLVASFGFNGQNLRADSAILPIAFYLHNLAPGNRYLRATEFMADRKQVRIWLTKSILKASGIWGSGLDTLLTLLRETIRNHGKNSFPVTELESSMARRGKALTFEDEEIDDLVELKYGEPRTFALLSMLFPFIDVTNHIHIDHIFPRAQFYKQNLKNAGLPENDIDTYQDMQNQLANLQLLDGPENSEKQQQLPTEWLANRYPDETSHATYRDKHLLGNVPDSMLGFQQFFNERKVRLHQQIRGLLDRDNSSNNTEADIHQ